MKQLEEEPEPQGRPALQAEALTLKWTVTDDWQGQVRKGLVAIIKVPRSVGEKWWNLCRSTMNFHLQPAGQMEVKPKTWEIKGEAGLAAQVTGPRGPRWDMKLEKANKGHHWGMEAA